MPTVVSAGISRDRRSASSCVGAVMFKVIRLSRSLASIHGREEGVHTCCRIEGTKSCWSYNIRHKSLCVSKILIG